MEKDFKAQLFSKTLENEQNKTESEKNLLLVFFSPTNLKWDSITVNVIRPRLSTLTRCSLVAK